MTSLDIITCERLEHSVATYKLLSASYDGFICYSELKTDGTLQLLHTLCTNLAIRSIASRYVFASEFLECFIVSEKTFTKVVISANSISENWMPLLTEQSIMKRMKSASLTIDTNNSTFENDPDTLSPTLLHGPLPSVHVPAPDNKNIAIVTLPVDLLESCSIDRELSFSDSSLLRPMTPYERIHATGLFLLFSVSLFLCFSVSLFLCFSYLNHK